MLAVKEGPRFYPLGHATGKVIFNLAALYGN